MYIVPTAAPGGVDDTLGIIKAALSFKVILEGLILRISALPVKINKLPSLSILRDLLSPVIEELIFARLPANTILPLSGIILTILDIFYKYKLFY
jgi:hypothetical protein